MFPHSHSGSSCDRGEQVDRVDKTRQGDFGISEEESKGSEEDAGTVCEYVALSSDGDGAESADLAVNAFRSFKLAEWRMDGQ